MNQHQEMTRQIHQTQSKLTKSSQIYLAQPNSVSSPIRGDRICAEQIPAPHSPSTNLTIPLRSVMKTGGLFNKDCESSEKLNDLAADGNEFTLHRLLSDIGVHDLTIDMNELAKFDPVKLLDVRSLSELLQGESFDQINMSNDIGSYNMDSIPPFAKASSSGSFSEFCPLTPDLPTGDILQMDASQLKTEPSQPLVYAQLNAVDSFIPTPTTANTIDEEFNFDPNVLAAFEHDYGFLSKRATIIDTPSPSPTVSKRMPVRGARRTSSRIQSRATIIDYNQLLNESPCSSPGISDASSISSKRKGSRHVNRATDIKTADDLAYYLERRRKNNEASKLSRAARKQKYGDMDSRCSEYERANADLRLKIAALETVTANLKNGLIHNFQRKSGVQPKT